MNNTAEKILVVLPLRQDQRDELERQSPKSEFLYRDQKTVPASDIEQANVIIGNVPVNYLKNVPHLQWLQLDSAGSDQYAALPVFNEERALLTNASGSYGLVISEYMVGAAIMMSVGFHTYRDRQNERIWQKSTPSKTIKGTKTLVVGLGDIGSHFAQKMHELGSEITAVRRTKTLGEEYIQDIYSLKELHDILPDFDLVALCLPHSNETQNIFDKAAFSRMKKGAFFINVGRGTTVDTDALAEALQCEQLGGATIDVTNPEPLPEDHPLWDCENAIITPHIAGLDEQKDAFEKIVNLSIRNLDAFVHCRKLECIVDPQTGYRKLYVRP